MQREHNQRNAERDFVMLIEPNGMSVVERTDGTASGLNAIGIAIIKAGFPGVRGLPIAGKDILWQVQSHTLEGAYFAYLGERAKRGLRLPSVSYVLELIRSCSHANEGGAQ
ncbi:hypothetical protein [Comamonas sp. C24C]